MVARVGYRKLVAATRGWLPEIGGCDPRWATGNSWPDHTGVRLRLAEACGRASSALSAGRLAALLAGALTMARFARSPHVLRTVVEAIADVVALVGGTDTQPGCPYLALVPVALHDDGAVAEVGLAEGCAASGTLPLATGSHQARPS